jgi:hypothetical protein
MPSEKKGVIAHAADAVKEVGAAAKRALNNPGTHLVGKAAEAFVNPSKVIREATGTKAKPKPSAPKKK